MRKLYLLANLAIFWAYAAAFLWAPVPFAQWLGITWTTNTGLADFRAMYGGMCLGVGVAYFRGMRQPAWETPALWLAVWTAAGLLLGRVMTLALEGRVGAFIYLSMACEVASIGAGLYLLSRPRQSLLANAA